MTLLEDSPYVFKAADFAFADPIDAPTPNAFLSIVIDALPDQGALTLNGGTVVAGQEVSLADIVEAVEGPIVMTSCVDTERHDCALEGACQVRPHMNVVNGAVRGALAGVSL